MNGTARDDGGPAFPTAVTTPFGDGRLACGGMTLRDYFAAAALQGLLNGNAVMPITWITSYAADAYAVADAMMKARKS